MPLRGDSITEDLLHRDLTINALAADEDGVLYAHPQAFDDLRHRVLRAASSHAFVDDPARIFRLARFAAVYPDCTLDEETIQQAAQVVATEAFAALPAERVGRELLKALHAPQPGRFLDVLHVCGALRYWFEELAGAADIPAGPIAYHRHHVLAHTVEVMNRTAGDPLAAWMALCHDLGKVLTDSEQWPHHYGHEVLGEASARALGERLLMPQQYQQAGILAARQHMKAGMYDILRVGTRCDLLMKMHKAHVHASFWRLAEADSGRSLRSRVDTDLACVLAVRLPKDWHNRGDASGRHLRELRCHALAETRDVNAKYS